MRRHELRRLNLNAMNRAFFRYRPATLVVALGTRVAPSLLGIVLQRQQSRFSFARRLQRFPGNGINVVTPSNERHISSKSRSFSWTAC